MAHQSKSQAEGISLRHSTESIFPSRIARGLKIPTVGGSSTSDIMRRRILRARPRKPWKPVQDVTFRTPRIWSSASSTHRFSTRRIDSVLARGRQGRLAGETLWCTESIAARGETFSAALVGRGRRRFFPALGAQLVWPIASARSLLEGRPAICIVRSDRCDHLSH